jgi:hypothetical protein
VRHKWAIAKSSVGTSTPNPLQEPTPTGDATPAGNSWSESTPAKSERLRSILESWETTGATANDGDDTILATIAGPQSGFLAAISTNDHANGSTPAQPQLLVRIAASKSTEHRVTTDIDAQIEACASATGDDAPTETAEYNHAVRAIEQWCARERASTAAGVGGPSTVHRNKITHRIDAAIQGAPPHLRSTRSSIAANARRVATTQQCEAIEKELDSLSRSELPADEWLKAIAALDPAPAADDPGIPSTGRAKIHALLLIRAITDTIKPR